MAGGVSGKTSGVGKDIVEYLQAVGEHYGVTIKVTSGQRDPEEQGVAMWDNWLEMKRGAVYHTATLPPADRKKLDGYYVIANEMEDATPEQKKKAEEAFKKLATEKVGKKTKHYLGRAVDVSTSSVNSKVYKAITLHMDEVKEGGRTDIYHFESKSNLPKVDDKLKAKWPK